MHERTPDDRRLGELMRAAQAGDADAYLALLQDLVPRVRQIVRRRRSPSIAEGFEDVVQEVLMSVHVARASYDPARPFFPWLLAIVRNRLADEARLYARHGAHEVQAEDLDVTFSDAASKFPAEGVGDVDLLRRAVRGLPRGQRDAIELLKVQGLSLKEAAAATGTSVGALKVATHRAMTALRRMLAAGGTHGD